jgi:hypothetical protein
MQKQFKATTGNVVKLISWLTFFILLAASYAIITIPFSIPVKSVIIGSIWLLFSLCYILAPAAYVVDDFNLMAIAKRQFVFLWPRKEIASAKLLSDDELARTWRIIGVGGLFGNYGLFYNRHMVG